MKKLITLSLLTLTAVVATACGTPTVETEKTTETASVSEIGSCMVSMNGSCQDYENLNGITVDALKSDCAVFGTWSDTKCPVEYSSGCKSQSQGISGPGTYDLSILYKKDNPFYNNVKTGCQGEWVEKQ